MIAVLATAIATGIRIYWTFIHVEQPYRRVIAHLLIGRPHHTGEVRLKCVRNAFNRSSLAHSLIDETLRPISLDSSELLIMVPLGRPLRTFMILTTVLGKRPLIICCLLELTQQYHVALQI
jgi:hypothetical protein